MSKKAEKPEPAAPILGPIVARNLARFREAADVTQMQLAARAAVSQTVVSRAERFGAISLEMAEKLAQAMGHHPCELFRRAR